MEIQNGADGTMSTVLSLRPSLGSLVTGSCLALLIACSSGCGGPGRPAVDTYLASVTNASPAQGVEDGQRIAQLFAELAARNGLTGVQPLPSDTVALYFPSSTGLNLSLSAINPGSGTLSIAVIPVNMGRRDNSACRTVIATVDKTFKQAFGARLLTAP
jgi:hypothetical protein